MIRCLLILQKVKDQVYAYFRVSKDPASQVNLDGEEKLKLKRMLA